MMRIYHIYFVEYNVCVYFYLFFSLAPKQPLKYCMSYGYTLNNRPLKHLIMAFQNKLYTTEKRAKASKNVRNIIIQRLLNIDSKIKKTNKNK